MFRVAVALTAVLLAVSGGYADILSTSASVRPDNSLLVDVQVTTGSSAAQFVVTYQTAGVEPLVSRLTPVSTTGPISPHQAIDTSSTRPRTVHFVVIEFVGRSLAGKRNFGMLDLLCHWRRRSCERISNSDATKMFFLVARNCNGDTYMTADSRDGGEKLPGGK